MPKSQFFYIANMHFNAIRENKILAKFSEYTVFKDYILFSGALLSKIIKSGISHEYHEYHAKVNMPNHGL